MYKNLKKNYNIYDVIEIDMWVNKFAQVYSSQLDPYSKRISNLKIKSPPTTGDIGKRQSIILKGKFLWLQYNTYSFSFQTKKWRHNYEMLKNSLNVKKWTINQPLNWIFTHRKHTHVKKIRKTHWKKLTTYHNRSVSATEIL